MRKPPRPTRVKVGAHTYRISYVKKQTLADCVGECCPDSKRIRVRRDVPPRYLCEIVTHELKHAIWHEFGIQNSQKGDAELGEESVINGLTSGLFAVLRDNPEFHKFLFYYSK